MSDRREQRVPAATESFPGSNSEHDSVASRVTGLEQEKVRLQSLVTELLFKNQQLRESLDRMSTPAHGKSAGRADETWFS